MKEYNRIQRPGQRQIYHRDNQQFCELLEDRIFGQGGGVAVGVRVSQAPETGPVVDLPGIPVLLRYACLLLAPAEGFDRGFFCPFLKEYVINPK